MYQFKRGSTFSYGGQLHRCLAPATEGESPSQVPINLTGATLTCDIRTSIGDKFVQHITTQILDADDGLFSLKALANETALWKTMIHYLDIKVITQSGDTIYSNTVPIEVVERYTR